MALSARGVPRFLPTLTEVVQIHIPPPEPPEDPALLELARREALAQHMRAHLNTVLDRRIEDAVAVAMLEQVDAIGDRLRQQLEDMVRASIESVTARLRLEVEDMVHEALNAAIAQDPADSQPDPIA